MPTLNPLLDAKLKRGRHKNKYLWQTSPGYQHFCLSHCDENSLADLDVEIAGRKISTLTELELRDIVNSEDSGVLVVELARERLDNREYRRAKKTGLVVVVNEQRILLDTLAPSQLKFLLDGSDTPDNQIPIITRHMMMQ